MKFATNIACDEPLLVADACKETVMTLPNTPVDVQQSDHDTPKQNAQTVLNKVGTLLMICGAIVLAVTLLRPMLFNAWESTGAQLSRLVLFDVPFMAEQKPAITQRSVVGDAAVTLGLRSNGENTHTIEIMLTDRNGLPVAARQAYLFLTMPGMLMGVDSIEAESRGTGHFVAEGSLFSMLGEWRIEASVERAPDDWVRVPFIARVGSNGAIEFVAPSDMLTAPAK